MERKASAVRRLHHADVGPRPGFERAGEIHRTRCKHRRDERIREREILGILRVERGKCPAEGPRLVLELGRRDKSGQAIDPTGERPVAYCATLSDSCVPLAPHEASCLGPDVELQAANV